MTDADFRKRFYWTIAGFLAALMTVVFAFVTGLIPPTLLPWAIIPIAVVGYVAFYRLLKRARDERRATGEFDKPLNEATRRRYRSSIRSLKIFVAILLFSLVFGLWSMRGDPAIPLAARIAGPAVNILLNVYCIWAIRKLQRRLK